MLIIALSLGLLVAGPTETPISIPSEPAPLYGTLLTPEGEARAAAVILPGSGPTDRDGNSPQFGLAAGTYRLLAEALVVDGIATVRIDKRAIGQSAAAGPDERGLSFEQYAADARAWAAEAADRAGRPCAWLIGHSEGSLVALAAVRLPDDRICGVISLSGLGRPAAAGLRDQLARMPEPLKIEAFHALDELEAGRPVEGTSSALAALFRPAIQPYLISWFALDPAALARAYPGPLMIVQGTTDLQVSVADAQALAVARPDATLLILEGVNHVLKAAPAEPTANMATYRDPALPLAPGLAQAVSAFILQP
jgi:alpha-beta hydrolase superfamily lysophospholipase